MAFLSDQIQNTYKKSQLTNQGNCISQKKKSTIFYFITSGCSQSIYYNIVEFYNANPQELYKVLPCKCLQMHNQAQRIKNNVWLVTQSREEVFAQIDSGHHLGDKCLVL